MASSAQPLSGYYVWEVAGKPVVVHVRLEVVDRMLADVMRGFGAVPKRGAEVGGVLIGTIERGEQTVVRIDDFEAVECQYKRGPSYLFVDDDRAAFEDVARRWQQQDSRPVYAVGFYRSHTREGMALSIEDIELMDECFPSPAHVALLIRPYATKVSSAGFFFREHGGFQGETPLEFPFRRRELTGEEAPPRRSMIERRPRGNRESRPVEQLTFGQEEEPMAPPEPEPAYAAAPPSKSRLRSAIWIPLSFVFLLVGVALGLMIGLTRAPGRAEISDFALGLSVAKADPGDQPSESGFNLNVKWDRSASAVRVAQRGVLEIEDGKYSKSVDLDTAQLSNGGIIYRNSSKTVRFRLTVYPRSRVSVTETAEWKQ